MQKQKGDRAKEFSAALRSPQYRVALVFALEGFLLQFATSVKNFGNNLFATNLGATDTQLGLIQTIGCAVTVALLLPMGILSDTRKSAKTVPVWLLVLGGLMFIMESLVPQMGSARLALFFVFMGLSSGLFGTYNGQWQSMFGDIVPIENRNRIYALRNRVMAALGVVVPILCGVAMSAKADSEGKIGVLSVFFFLAGLFMLAQAFVVYKIPGGHRSAEQLSAVEHFSVRTLRETVSGAVKNKPFVAFVLASMFFYTSWHFDWSMWFIGQTQYIKMSEAQLSYFNAMCCIAQMFIIGVHARTNQKRTVHYTVCWGIASMPVYPLVMIGCQLIPAPSRQWIFMVLCTGLNMLECSIVMCLVQMLLEVVPEKHRSLVVSLYTVLVTISNSIMPLAGVRLYTVTGANITGFRTFFLVDFVWRIFVLYVFIRRYKRLKSEGRIVPQINGM